MTNKALIFDISELLDASTGTSINYSIKGEFLFNEIEGHVPVTSKVEIMRIEKGFNVRLRDLMADVVMRCGKCLTPFNVPISVDGIERQFYMKMPENLEDPLEVFPVDAKNQKLDISDMLRQEIILHLPLIPVCSESCKGICPTCGQNLNEKQCNCPKEETEGDYKPLAKLKDLLK